MVYRTKYKVQWSAYKKNKNKKIERKMLTTTTTTMTTMTTMKSSRTTSPTTAARVTTMMMCSRLPIQLLRLLRSTVIICVMAFFCFSMVSGQIDWADDEDDPVSLVNVDAVLGKASNMTCDIEPELKDDRVYMVLWFREDAGKPIYSFDVRGRPNTQALVWSDENLFGPRAKFYPNNNPSYLQIVNIGLDDAGIYRCRVDFQNSPTRNHRINLTVIVPPHQMLVYDKSGRDLSGIIGPLLEGDTMVLTCEVRGGDPEPLVSWYNGTELIQSSTGTGSGRNEIVNRLTIESVNRYAYNTTFRCQAYNTKLMQPIQRTFKLDMLLKPLVVRIIEKNVTKFIADMEYTIRCEVIGSVPDADVRWTQNNRILDRGKITQSTVGNKVISKLTFRPKPDDDNKKLKCEGFNPRLQHTSLEDSIEFSVVYQPQVSLSLGSTLNPDDIKEGDDVYFECHIKANPKENRITWSHNGDPIVQSVAHGVIISAKSLVLQRVGRIYAGLYSCSAANDRGENQSSVVELKIHYAPVCTSAKTIVVGTSLEEPVAVPCRVIAYPQDVSFEWTFSSSGERFEVPHGRYTTVQLNNDIGSSNTLIETNKTKSYGTMFMEAISELIYVPKTEREYGTLSCWGTNSIGKQSEPCLFQVLAAAKPAPLRNCTLRPYVHTPVSASLQVAPSFPSHSLYNYERRADDHLHDHHHQQHHNHHHQRYNNDYDEHQRRQQHHENRPQYPENNDDVYKLNSNNFVNIINDFTNDEGITIERQEASSSTYNTNPSASSTSSSSQSSSAASAVQKNNYNPAISTTTTFNIEESNNIIIKYENVNNVTNDEKVNTLATKFYNKNETIVNKISSVIEYGDKIIDDNNHDENVDNIKSVQHRTVDDFQDNSNISYMLPPSTLTSSKSSIPTSLSLTPLSSSTKEATATAPLLPNNNNSSRISKRPYVQNVKSSGIKTLVNNLLNYDPKEIYNSQMNLQEKDISDENDHDNDDDDDNDDVEYDVDEDDNGAESKYSDDKNTNADDDNDDYNIENNYKGIEIDISNNVNIIKKKFTQPYISYLQSDSKTSKSHKSLYGDNNNYYSDGRVKGDVSAHSYSSAISTNHNNNNNNNNNYINKNYNTAILDQFDAQPTAIELECVAGYDGGLPQIFVLEVYNSNSHKLRLNITSSYSDSPVFRFDLADLSPSDSYGIAETHTLLLKAYSANQKGRSDPIVLEDIAINEAEKRTDDVGLSILPFAAFSTGLLLIFGIGALLLVVLAIRKKRDSASQSSCDDKNKHLAMDMTVTAPIDMGIGQQRYIVAYTIKQGTEKQPDILNPQKNSSESIHFINETKEMGSSQLPNRPDALFLTKYNYTATNYLSSPTYSAQDYEQNQNITPSSRSSTLRNTEEINTILNKTCVSHTNQQQHQQQSTKNVTTDSPPLPNEFEQQKHHTLLQLSPSSVAASQHHHHQNNLTNNTPSFLTSTLTRTNVLAADDLHDRDAFFNDHFNTTLDYRLNNSLSFSSGPMENHHKNTNYGTSSSGSGGGGVGEGGEDSGGGREGSGVSSGIGGVVETTSGVTNSSTNSSKRHNNEFRMSGSDFFTNNLDFTINNSNQKQRITNSLLLNKTNSSSSSKQSRNHIITDTLPGPESCV